MNRARVAAALLLLAAFALAPHARADEPPEEKSTIPPALAGVDIVEHLGQALPADLDLVDETGRLVRLGDYLRGDRPVLLYLGYFKCPMLCSLVLNGLVSSLLQVDLQPGKDYTLLTVSIDPAETPRDAAERQRGYVQAMNGKAQPSDWHFLTGREPQLRALSDAVGFKYNYDPQTRTFGHSAVLFLLAPTSATGPAAQPGRSDRVGRITRYLYGVRFEPRDLRLALVEAGEGKVGTSYDRVLLQCYRYDPATRRYGWFVFGTLRIGGALIGLVLALFLARYWRREIKSGGIR